jgi:hypothetical protein
MSTSDHSIPSSVQYNLSVQKLTPGQLALREKLLQKVTPVPLHGMDLTDYQEILKLIKASSTDYIIWNKSLFQPVINKLTADGFEVEAQETHKKDNWYIIRIPQSLKDRVAATITEADITPKPIFGGFSWPDFKTALKYAESRLPVKTITRWMRFYPFAFIVFLPWLPAAITGGVTSLVSWVITPAVPLLLASFIDNVYFDDKLMSTSLSLTVKKD